MHSIVPMWYICGMKLAEYLQKHSLSASEFARRIGVSHSAVVRYRNGKRRPDWQTLQKITEETGGAVSAQDFFEKSAAA